MKQYGEGYEERKKALQAENFERLNKTVLFERVMNNTDFRENYKKLKRITLWLAIDEFYHRDTKNLQTQSKELKNKLRNILTSMRIANHFQEIILGPFEEAEI